MVSQHNHNSLPPALSSEGSDLPNSSLRPALLKLPKIWGGKCHYPLRSLCEEAGPRRGQGCSAGLLPQEPRGPHFCFEAPSALLCYCVSCKGSSCFRRKPDSTWQGLHLLAPGLFQLFLHHTKADHRLLSLNCSAVIMVCPSCPEQAATTAGVGQECCSFPLLLPHLVWKLSLSGPPEHSRNMQRWSSLFQLMLKKINSHFNIPLLFLKAANKLIET